MADKGTCSRACYWRLFNYSNQVDHPRLDRFLIRDYLFTLRQAITTELAQGRSYEEQYVWLQEKRDPNSSLEAKFLSVLYASRRRLPDRAQFRPEEGVSCEADFYYERDGLKGVALFVDGPHHDDPIQRAKDTAERAKLEDLGYRVLVVRYDRDIQQQVGANADVFGPGTSAITEEEG